MTKKSKERASSLCYIIPKQKVAGVLLITIYANTLNNEDTPDLREAGHNI